MEKKKGFLISGAYYLGIAAIVFILVKYVLAVVMPFVIGFAIAALLNPIVRRFTHRYKMRYRAAAVFVLLLAYTTVGSLVVCLILQFVVWIGDFSGKLPELYRASVEPAIGSVYEWISGLVSRFAPDSSNEVVFGLGGFFEALSSSLKTAVSDLSVRVLSFLSGVAATIPRVILSLGFAVISSFFFIVDFENILLTIKNLLPSGAVGFMSDVRGKFFSTILKYLRSYALIMLITFSMLFFGLSVIGTPSAAPAALIISLLDVLPVIGTGIVMIPWAAISMFTGRVGYGVGLIIIWGTIAVTRNVIEPKIVGKQVGLHPLVTLIAMFVGTKLFGLVGLVLFPVGLSIGVSVARERHQISGE